ncbi:hypothetical protein [Actinomadura monticuli]|uniref:Uncharacterized protein n=1 Tax=Actinomadura monticuli TaxID=3097367 RepID=A0ABV4QG47_9ACTN
MDVQLVNMVISDAMPIVAAFLSAWLTRGRGPRPPSGPLDEADFDQGA